MFLRSFQGRFAPAEIHSIHSGSGGKRENGFLAQDRSVY